MNNQLKPFRFNYARSSAGVSLSQPLSFAPKQVIWLVGASGSGKTTFLHLLKGFFPEFLAGHIEGESPSFFKKAMYLAQNPLSQIVHERVGEEFFFGLENNYCHAEYMHNARHWLSLFQLEHREFDATSQLSHGLSQRLLLASQLASQPDWMLLDEPTAFLNPTMRDDFYEILHQLKGQIGMVLIDHHYHAAKFADVCWYVDADGEISEMSVADWMSHQASLLQKEYKHPKDPWQVSKLDHSYQLTASKLAIGYGKKTLFTGDFSLKSGECAVLIGDNGTGKSTFFNTLAGLQKPLSGSIVLTQNSLPLKRMSTYMSYVFQHPDSHFYFDTIAEELQQLGVTNIPTTLEQIGLPNTDHRSPHLLSEGQKRRLTLLYPCLQKRPLVLLDEPIFGQDAVNILRITRLINALKHAGHAIIVIAHNAIFQANIADQIWHIQKGQLHNTRLAK